MSDQVADQVASLHAPAWIHGALVVPLGGGRFEVRIQVMGEPEARAVAVAIEHVVREVQQP